jgi:hypothetical protein
MDEIHKIWMTSSHKMTSRTNFVKLQELGFGMH